MPGHDPLIRAPLQRSYQRVVLRAARKWGRFEELTAVCVGIVFNRLNVKTLVGKVLKLRVLGGNQAPALFLLTRLKSL